MDGDACGPWCGWCSRCSDGTPANAVCRTCGRDYYRDEDHLGYDCDRCLANARARAECTVEHRRVDQPKVEKVIAAEGYEVNR